MVLMTMEDKLEIFGLDTIQVLKCGPLVLIVLHYYRHGIYLWVRFTSSPKTLNATGFELVESVSQQEACWWEKKKA